MRKDLNRGKRLRLSMETIRNLTPDELHNVAGGTQSCTSCDHSGGSLTSLSSERCTRPPR